MVNSSSLQTVSTAGACSNHNWDENPHTEVNKDHFISKGDYQIAGHHLIADFWQCERLDDIALMESAMRAAVDAAGATLLHIHLHHFSPNGGVSGVAVLAESHISVHTWPEYGFAAFDVFMCGDAKPELAIEHLAEVFQPQGMDLKTLERGDSRSA